MSLEQGRALAQGIMILAGTAIAYRVSLPIGAALLAFIGFSRIQESVTDFCPSDLILKPLGLKKRAAA